MRVNYDPEADILYIIIREGPVKDTVEAGDEIFIEVTEDEKIAGIEVWKRLKEHLRADREGTFSKNQKIA